MASVTAPVSAGRLHELLAKARSVRTELWSDKAGLFGVVVLVGLVLLAVFAPVLAPFDPAATSLSDRLMPPAWLDGGQWTHPLGTDNLGRDMLAQIIAGGRVSLAVGVTAMLLSLILGAIIGVLAGYFRRLDGVLMRFTDLFLALPLLPLLLVIIMLFRDSLRTAFGPESGIFILIVFVIGITSWMQTARIVRGEVLSVKEEEFVLAANSIGTRKRNVIFRHVLPNVLSPVMVAAALCVAVAIITESALSFLGLGFPSDFPTWGRLVTDAKDTLQITPARVIWPGMLISLTVISVNFIGDGLRDALDPRLRSR